MNGALAVPVAVVATALFAAAAAAVRHRATVRSSILGTAGTGGTRGTGMLRRGLGRAATTAAVWVGVALGGFAVAGPVGAIGGAAAVVVAPSVRRRHKRAVEVAALDDGLAEAVAVIASAIRAGRSMTGALQEAASTVGPPIGPRLGVLVDRVALGVPVDRAVLDLAASVPGPDARLVAAILGLHQRSGGDAPAVLDRVARTLRERRASAREVRSLTAQARLSGAILGFLPVGFFLFLSVTARSDVEHALASSTGRAAIIAGVLMQGTAFLWIRHLLRVDA